ncbi:hypothetical protein QW131_08840 [Roseibium salinum]|nr:hypothetical protein [Roseibium salinum]
MKPSQAALLQEASAVFWVGPELAPALAKPIRSMADDAVVVEFMESAGIHHLDIREGTSFDSHDHDHGDEHEEAHGEHEGEETHEEHAAHEYHEDDAHEAGHEHVEAHDPHLWLNPEKRHRDRRCDGRDARGTRSRQCGDLPGKMPLSSLAVSKLWSRR